MRSAGTACAGSERAREPAAHGKGHWRRLGGINGHDTGLHGDKGRGRGTADACGKGDAPARSRRSAQRPGESSVPSRVGLGSGSGRCARRGGPAIDGGHGWHGTITAARGDRNLSKYAWRRASAPWSTCQPAPRGRRWLSPTRRPCGASQGGSPSHSRLRAQSRQGCQNHHLDHNRRYDEYGSHDKSGRTTGRRDRNSVGQRTPCPQSSFPASLRPRSNPHHAADDPPWTWARRTRRRKSSRHEEDGDGDDITMCRADDDGRRHGATPMDNGAQGHRPRRCRSACDDGYGDVGRDGALMIMCAGCRRASPCDPTDERRARRQRATVARGGGGSFEHDCEE